MLVETWKPVRGDRRGCDISSTAFFSKYHEKEENRPLFSYCGSVNLLKPEKEVPVSVHNLVSYHTGPWGSLTVFKDCI